MIRALLANTTIALADKSLVGILWGKLDITEPPVSGSPRKVLLAGYVPLICRSTQ